MSLLNFESPASKLPMTHKTPGVSQSIMPRSMVAVRSGRFRKYSTSTGSPSRKAGGFVPMTSRNCTLVPSRVANCTTG